MCIGRSASAARKQRATRCATIWCWRRRRRNQKKRTAARMQIVMAQVGRTRKPTHPFEKTKVDLFMKIQRLNWPVWAGFLLSLSALLSYPFVFVRWPITRDFPWANLLLFGIAAALLGLGIRRAFAGERPRRSKVAGVIVTALSVLIFGLFIFSTLI